MFWKPFSETEEKQIRAAIEKAEVTFSGEIRVHVDRYCKSNPFLVARNTFNKLEMGKTMLQNGVLIYVALEDHKFAIIGDSGINDNVPEGFWDGIRDDMARLLADRKVVEAIETGIERSAEELKKHFPPVENDENELPDDISYGS